ncbi:MAG: hypothetical protein Q9191_002840 [Dirinaria sp. TL-2023a]
METPSRPQNPHQSTRVPGGFETDEELSPIKTAFSDDDHQQKHHESQQAGSAASAGVVEDNSMITSSSEDGGIHLQEDESTLEEREIRKKLLEEDSTFLPPLSPFAGSGRYDTLTSGAALHSFVTPNRSYADDDISQESIESASGVYQTPAPGRQPSPQKQVSGGDEAAASSPDLASSSPTVKAAARKPSRPTSAASTEGYKTAYDEQQGSEVANDFAEEDPTPRKVTPPPVSSASQPAGSPTPTKRESFHSADASSSTNVTDTDASPLRRKRPNFLHSRVSTQKSSFSTYTIVSTEAGSDATLGADYALQTGGAAPFGSSTSSRPRIDYSRTTSLGSMVSGISGISDEDSIKPRSGPLEEMRTVSEEDPSITRTEDFAEPETPRVASTSTEIPTDTVLARRVNDVEVPATAAREYRSLHGPSSPDKRGAPTPSITRNGRNLTLKEQSGTIDRLTKENFDLKMKITFLNDSLNKRSPEGVASLVNENADLKASKVTSAKEIRDLKRSIRDLERSLRSKEQEFAAEVRKAKEETEQAASDAHVNQEMEEELLFLRDRVISYDVEIERMRHESLVREGEKKRMADILQSRRSGASDAGLREEVDMWKDQLETETALREQADEENKKLREEIWRLENENPSEQQHLSNGYHPSETSSHRFEQVDISIASSKTLIDLVGKLRHDNAALHREVAAQLNMLTSRNREKQTLDQEIEELKLAARREGTRSMAGDSIFERSVSRAHGRSISRHSNATRITQLSDSERDSYENRIGQLRDKNAQLEIEVQDVTRGLNTCLNELEQLDTMRNDHQNLQQLYETDIEQATQDLQTMQAERDEALRVQEDLEADLQNLQNEAEGKIASLAEELESKDLETRRLDGELGGRGEDLEALRFEFTKTSEVVIRLEDDMNIKAARMAEMEQEIECMNEEMDTARDEYNSLQSKNDRVTVQHESLQKEIAFLREEQDSDKIRIGDLQAELTSERDRAKELDSRLAQEKHQREVIDSKEKRELQRIMDELNHEVSDGKAETRELRQSLQSREVEVTTFKERLSEWESNLREILGEPDGTRSSLLTSITRLQKELDSTASELDSTKTTLSQKEHLLRARDSLLESHGLESKKLSELLDRERQARRSDKAQHEQWQKTHQHTSRTVTQKDQRITELEHSRQSDRKKIASLETTFREKIDERNQLLLTLWNKMAPMCGSDWQHHNALVNNHLPTLEVVSSQLPAFTKSLLNAVRTVEGLLLGFSGKINTIERDLWKEYQSLETAHDTQIKKLDKLEASVQANRVSGTFSAAPEIAKLRGENRLLKSEIAVLQKQDLHARTSRAVSSSSPSSSSPSKQNPSSTAAPAPTLARHFSSSAVESLNPPPLHRSVTLGNVSSNNDHNQHPHHHPLSQIPPQSQPLEPSQQRLILRLRELERRLKAEREARLLDRTAARKRLEEGMEVNEQLRGELERERGRKGR